MNNLKAKALAPVNFVKKHRVAIAVVATSYCWIKINGRALAAHDEFLKDKGLYEEFYTEETE